MYNRGDYKDRTFWSHGNLTEGFKYYTGKTDKDGRYQETGQSGWFVFKPLLKGFEKAVRTGKFEAFSLKDDEGKVHKFSKHEQELLMEEYLGACFERLAEMELKKKLKIMKKFDLKTLAKLAGE